MTTPNDTAGTLSEKEGEDLFQKAYSEISGREHTPSSFVAETPAVEQKVETPSTEPEASTEPVVEAAPVVVASTEEAKTTPTTPAETKAPASTIEGLLEQFPEDKRDIVKQLLNERNLAQQQFRSHQGRLAAERQERRKAEQELVKFRTRGASSPQDPTLAAQTKLDHTQAIAEWKQVVEAEPTLAKAIDALTDAKVSGVKQELRTEYDKAEELRNTQDLEDRKAQEWELVVQAVPNVVDVVRSKEFGYWKDNLAPPSVRHSIDNSIDHRDAIHAIQQFAHYATWLNEQNGTGKAQTQAANPQVVTTPTVADQISEHRNEKPSSVVKGGVARPNVSADPGNEFGDDVAERLFQEAYKKVTQR